MQSQARRTRRLWMVPLRRGSEEVRVARRISTHVGQRIRRRAVVIVHTRVDAAHREAVDVRRVFVTGRRVCAIRRRGS